MEDFRPLSYIYKPSAQAVSRVLLLLHGTGGNERDLFPLAALLEGDYNLLGVRGNVSENGMPRFFRRLGMGVFDEADLEFRAGELREFLINTAEKEGFDVSEIIALGYSNGANIAAAMMALYPEFLRGSILYRPMQPFRDPAMQKRNGLRTPVFISNGATDPMVSRAEAAAYEALLRDAGFDVTSRTLEAGHQLTHEDIVLTNAWLKVYPG